MNALSAYTDFKRLPVDYTSPYMAKWCDGRSLIPTMIPDATWQAGVSRGNEKLKPALNGNPVAGCFAAMVGERGWIKCVHPKIDTTADADPFRDDSLIIHGVVTLIPVSRSHR